MACTSTSAGTSARRQLRRWLFSLCTCLLLCPLQAAQAASMIRTAAQEASEPKFISITVDGKPAVGGICIDIMRAIEAIEPAIKFTGDQEWLPLARMQSNQMDAICGLLYTKERALKYEYVDIPLFSVSYMLVVRADDEIQVSDWDDIRKLGSEGVILSMHNFAINDYLKNLGGLQLDTTAVSSRSNLNKLLARRGRFYCHRSPGIVAEIRKAGLEGKVRILPKVMLKEQLYMVLSKNLGSEQIKRIKTAITQLDSQGILARLFEKYQE